MKARLAIAGAAALVLLSGQAPTAHVAMGQRWAPEAAIVMQLQLGTPALPLADGHPSWNAVAAGALATWNQVLNGVAFGAVLESVEAPGLQNNLNNIIWGDDVYGESFGDALAIAKWLYIVEDNTTVEADIVFNRSKTWDSYRGALRRAPQGGFINDFRRVALHELGHALGLGHPDDNAQVVRSIMNRQTSEIDDLQPDDIEGVQAIYGVRPAAPPAEAPPAEAPPEEAPPGGEAPPAAEVPPTESQPARSSRG